jgi:signal transduction histidine kinase
MPFPHLRPKAIAVQVHAPEGALTVAVDRRRIARVLHSLTENAAQYTPQGGRLDVWIATGSPLIRVEYRNNSGELTAEDVPFIFERFFRGKIQVAAAWRGGIGLAIVKELVEHTMEGSGRTGQRRGTGLVRAACRWIRKGRLTDLPAFAAINLYRSLQAL